MNKAGYIKIDIKREKEHAIDMLHNIGLILKSDNIVFWLDSGTLLGAVRDQKMIPWDCEFDIGLWQIEQNMLNEILKKIKKQNYRYEVRPDQILIYEKDKDVGVFILDLHFYKQRKGIAYHLFGKEPKNILSKIILYFIWFMDLEQVTKVIFLAPVYHKLMDIFENDFTFIDNSILYLKNKDNPNHEISVILKNNGKKYYIPNMLLGNRTRHIFLPNQLFNRIITNFICFFKNFVSPTIIKKVNRLLIQDLTNEIPQYYFEDLIEIDYYGKNYFIPKEYTKYLCLLYGSDWNIPKINWNLGSTNCSSTLKHSHP